MRYIKNASDAFRFGDQDVDVDVYTAPRIQPNGPRWNRWQGFDEAQQEWTNRRREQRAEYFHSLANANANTASKANNGG